MSTPLEGDSVPAALGPPAETQAVAAAAASNDTIAALKVGMMSGAVAGALVDVTLFPLDTIKTRLQSGDRAVVSAGLFRGLYSGLLPTVIASAPAAATFFGTYDVTKRLGERWAPEPLQGAATHMFAAAAGDVTGSAVRVPFEIVKQRLQAGVVAGAAAAVRQILSERGVKGLFRGYKSLVLRELPFDLIEFPLYEFLKLRLAKQLEVSRLDNHQSAMCGAVAGGFAAAITTPLDVLKTRVMLGRAQTGGVALMACQLRSIAAREGAAALFAGVLPRVTWISLGGFVFFGSYEATKNALRR